MSELYDMLRGTIVVIVMIFSLSACSAGADAERQFEMVDRAEPDTVAGDIARCEAARKVEQAYLQSNSESNYRRWKQRTWTLCLIADLRRQRGH